MIDVILINCFFGSPSEFGASAPPLGLGYLASVLEREGISVEIVDPTPLGLSKDEVIQIVKRRDPIVIGLNCLTTFRHDTFDIAKRIKHEFRNSKIVIGGPHVTFNDVITLNKIPEIDAIVRGEGEFTLLDYIKTVSDEEKLSEILGLTFRKSNIIKRNADRPLIKDLDSLPFPSYHLLPMDRYKTYDMDVPSEIRKMPQGSVMTSRGCPYNCIFCSSCNYWKRWFRARIPAKVVDEIEYLYNKFKLRYIRFFDDTFNIIPKRALEISENIRERRLDIVWRALVRADGINEKLVKSFSKSGCFQLEVGVESGSPRILDILNKKINLEQVQKVVELCKKYGITAKGFFIIGNPSETFSDYLKTLKVMRSFDFVGISTLKISPGSELYYKLKLSNKFSDETWFNSKDEEILYTETFDKETLRFLTSIAQIYFRLSKFQIQQLVKSGALQLSKVVV